MYMKILVSFPLIRKEGGGGGYGTPFSLKISHKFSKISYEISMEYLLYNISYKR